MDVRIDRAAPTLAPTLTPTSPAAGYAIGAVVTATPNATDATAGVASSSCGAVDTATAGTRTVACIATDIAGNTGNLFVSYIVAAPAPAYPYTVAIALPTAGSTVKAGGIVPVQFKLTGPAGQKLTALQGLVITLSCGAQVTVGSLPPVCAIYNPLTGNFITAVAIPKAATAGTAPVSITVTDRSAALAAAATTIKVTR